MKPILQAGSDIDLEFVRARLNSARAPQYWRSLEQVADATEFEEFLGHEFPDGAAEWQAAHRRSMTRRFRVLLEWDRAEEVWVTFVPALDSLSTFGNTRNEALEQTREVWVRREMPGQRLDRRVQLRRPEHPRRRSHQIDDRPEPALEHGFVERLLAGKVVVEARRRETHLACEIADRHPIDAAGREQALGCVEDGLARRQRRRRLGPRRNLGSHRPGISE